MLFILPGILLIGIAALLIWGLFFRATLAQERTVRQARQRRADFERLLCTDGEPLYCVSCREMFRGPLSAEGCPRCQVRAFVIPVRASNDPEIAGLSIPLRQPVIDKGGKVREDVPDVVGDSASQPLEIIQQGKEKR